MPSKEAYIASAKIREQALVDEVATNLPSNEVVDTPHQHRVRTLFAALKEHGDGFIR